MWFYTGCSLSSRLRLCFAAIHRSIRPDPSMITKSHPLRLPPATTANTVKTQIIKLHARTLELPLLVSLLSQVRAERESSRRVFSPNPRVKPWTRSPTIPKPKCKITKFHHSKIKLSTSTHSLFPLSAPVHLAPGQAKPIIVQGDCSPQCRPNNPFLPIPSIQQTENITKENARS